jgi:hypothetical protein
MNKPRSTFGICAARLDGNGSHWVGSAPPSSAKVAAVEHLPLIGAMPTDVLQ